MKKRILTAVLAICMTVTTIGMDAQAFYGESVSGEEQQKKVTQPAEGQLEASQSDENLEETDEPAQTEAQSEETTQIEEGTKETTQPEVEQEETTQPVVEGEKSSQQEAVLNYLLMEKDNMDIPDTQKIVASLGKEGTVISNAKLNYQNETTGEEFTVDASQAVQDMVLFSMEFKDASQTGSYVLKSIVYAEDGVEQNISLAEAEMNVRFGVNTKVEAEPDDVLINEDVLKEVEANIVTMDENGNTVSENNVENILDNSQTAFSAKAGRSAVTAERGAKNLVVVLDPGHDSTHAGSQYYGAGEENLNLKIAQYCQNELNQYSGITVYMVRDTQACPYGGWPVTKESCNTKRVEYAVSKGADVYVSFHLNASSSNVPQGVGIYYPNSNYRPDLSQESLGLATEIFNKLSALGLSNWAGGTLIRNSESDPPGTYPDGSIADYLGIIRQNKLAGIPAVLIEHAFLSSYSDYMNFLSSDEKLKNLGVADANAIVSYYGLKKKGALAINYVQSKIGGKLRVSWNGAGDGISYELYKSRRSDQEFTKVATINNKTYFEDSDIITGKRYFYKIRAVYSDGSKSEFSQIRSGIALGRVNLNYVQSIRSKKLELNWNKMTGAGGYNIYRRAEGSDTFELIKTINDGNTQKYADVVPDNNVVYYYTVRAINTSGGLTGCGSASGEKYGRAVAQPKIESVVSVTDQKLKVSWNKIDGARGYMITRSTEKNGSYSVIANISSGSVTTYEDTAVTAGVTYYYRVAATNIIKGRKGYGGYSAVKQGRSIAKTSIKWVKSMDEGTLEIRWNKIPGAYGYKVRRSDTENGTYKTIAVIRDGNAIKYWDKDVTAGKKYYYIVQTANKVDGITGESGFCKPAVGRAVAKTNINYVRSFSSNQIEVNWNEVDWAYGYRIRRSTSINGEYSTIVFLTGKNITTYQDTKVKPGQKYYYKVEVINSVNRVKGMSGYSKAIAGIALEKAQIESIKAENGKKITLTWKPAAGTAGYQIKRSTSEKGPYIVLANINGNNISSYTDNTVEEGKTYYYAIRGFRKSFYRYGYSSYSSKKKVMTAYSIMGGSDIEIADMVKYYNAKFNYPAFFYSTKGAPNIQTFCQILKQEAEDEGVRAEVLFAQVILETGGLQYKGDVRMEQCNFGGLGATGNGVTGETFPNVRIGLRAQVQHLKAYASKEPLKKTCVDNRFKYVKRGSAPYVEWLPIPKNPNGAGWAADPDYDVKLLKIIRDVI